MQIAFLEVITPELKEAWAKYKRDDWSGCGRVFAAYLDAEARARKAEFKLEHCESDLPYEPKEWCDKCDCSRFSGNWDERHTWELPQWRAAVVKELEEHA